MNFEQFHVLGETIRSELFLANNDEQKLPQIAACALSRADLETDLDLNAIGEFLRTTPVRQQPQTDFSDLPLVFYRCDAFHVEMLIWTGSSTTIHQHSFSGAFRVFAGSSLHSEYEFEARYRFPSRLAAALPFDPEDFRTEALLMTLLDGLDEEQMMARLMGKFSS